MAKRIYINDDWLFGDRFEQGMLQADYEESQMKKVRIPHTCKETPYHYFDESIYQTVSGYRRKLTIPKEWQGKQILLTLEGAAHDSEVYVNGAKVGEHHCGYTAFTMDITGAVIFGSENSLAVKVDSRENLNIPPFGFVVDYMTYGGIYRDVYIEVKEPSYIEDVFLHGTLGTLGSSITIRHPNGQMKVAQYIRPRGEGEYRFLGECELRGEVISDSSLCGRGNGVLEGDGDICTGNVVNCTFPVGDVALWDIDNPALYEVKTCLLQGEKVLDEVTVTHGFREAVFKKDGFYLNGKKVKIRGLNRHQSYPYVGYAMPKSMQCLDADILKKELGVNAVRTSHYPQSHYFLDRCDEIGLLVFTEIPGWQHIGDKAWKKQAVQNVTDMVVQYRNHPSIILWGVRINESRDDDEFYERTNAAARAADPYRQTAGVRAHKKSSFLEDVYTYNDFSHDGKAPGCEPKRKVTPDVQRAYLISEYNGHMYPTKAFDWEEHRAEHAIRHANVLNAVAGWEDIAGSFGWCMADYNTHKDFGSGDRICYHGVMDMFRNPKLAADIYACQGEEITLSLSSTMDIGEHPGCNRGDTWIFTNSDSVRMYKNDRFIKEYRKEDSPYSNLLHGPILIDDFIGDAISEGENFKPKQAEAVREVLNLTARYGLSNLPKKVILLALKLIFIYGMNPARAVELYNRYIGDWGGASTVYRFEAIKDGKVVRTVVKAPMKERSLWAQADHQVLTEEHSYDVAAIRIRMQDENGNLLHFFNEPVTLETEGAVELIGDSVISLKGGMGGCYVKTTGVAGEGALTLKASGATPVKIEFSVQMSAEESIRCK